MASDRVDMGKSVVASLRDLLEAARAIERDGSPGVGSGSREMVARVAVQIYEWIAKPDRKPDVDRARLFGAFFDVEPSFAYVLGNMIAGARPHPTEFEMPELLTAARAYDEAHRTHLAARVQKSMEMLAYAIAYADGRLSDPEFDRIDAMRRSLGNFEGNANLN